MIQIGAKNLIIGIYKFLRLKSPELSTSSMISFGLNHISGKHAGAECCNRHQDTVAQEVKEIQKTEAKKLDMTPYAKSQR